MSEVKDILNERTKTHGDFYEVSMTYDRLKDTMYYNADKCLGYLYTQKLAIDMICQKLARIKCGDANFKDHWLDIAGYATLVVNELERLENGSK